jgi:5'-3' exonuclease
VRVHLVDGTYELFRAYFGAPKATGPKGNEVGATRGIARSLLALLREDGVSHVGCAFDHVIESFRNSLFAGYKTSEGVPEDLMAQFPLAEQAARALGIVVWPMVEFEADDALATAAARFKGEVDRTVICSPDKDLAQCVEGSRVVLFDRMRKRTLDEAGVGEKFGVAPTSIPDWLALVGDAADGIPGVPGWGKKSAATLLAAFRHLEEIPDDEKDWKVAIRGAAGLAQSLREHREEVALYRVLATLRTDVPLLEGLGELEWRGARRDELLDLCRETGDEELVGRVPRFREPA